MGSSNAFTLGLPCSASCQSPGNTCAAAARQARQASRIALITLALYFVTMASQVVTAWNSKRTNERRWHMTVPLLLGAAGLMCAPPCSAIFGLWCWKTC